jgi:hypothetical protein
MLSRKLRRLNFRHFSRRIQVNDYGKIKLTLFPPVSKTYVFEPVEGYAKSLEKSISRSLDRKQDFGLLFYLN